MIVKEKFKIIDSCHYCQSNLENERMSAVQESSSSQVLLSPRVISYCSEKKQLTFNVRINKMYKLASKIFLVKTQ